MLSVGGLVRSRVLLRLRGPAAAAGGGGLVRWTGPAAVSVPEGPVRSVSSVGGASGAGGLYSSLLDSAPVHLCENFLVGVQQVSGFPWWLSIVTAAVSVRTIITLPLAVYQLIILSKVEALQVRISELSRRLHYKVSARARERGWTDKQSRFQFQKNLHRPVSQLYIGDICYPLKASLLIWIQVPLWISFSLALWNLNLDRSGLMGELAAGGTLWFPDLTVPDSTLILPVCLGLINLVIIEVFSLQQSKTSHFLHLVQKGLRYFSVLMIPIAATVPSSMALYWFCSSLVGFSQNLLLRSPKLHRILRLPTRRSDTPYRDLVSAFIVKYCK